MNRLLVLIAISLLLAACSAGNNASVPVAATTPPPNDLACTGGKTKRDPVKAAKLLKEASVKFLAGDKSGAAELLDEAIPLDPDNPELLAFAARTMEKLQRYELARDLYLRAAKHVEGKALFNMQTGAAHCSELLAHEQYKAGEYDAAWESIQPALEGSAISRDTQMLHGYIQMQRKEYKDAAEGFEAAVGLSTGAPRYEALSWLGQAQYAGEEYQAAIETFTQLIDQNVEGFEAYGYRAYCQVALENRAAAESDFRQALQRTKDHAKQDEYRNALKALEEAK